MYMLVVCVCFFVRIFLAHTHRSHLRLSRTHTQTHTLTIPLDVTTRGDIYGATCFKMCDRCCLCCGYDTLNAFVVLIVYVFVCMCVWDGGNEKQRGKSSLN